MLLAIIDTETTGLDPKSEVKEIEKRDGEKVPQIAVTLFDEV